jgi:hypothetical protein
MRAKLAISKKTKVTSKNTAITSIDDGYCRYDNSSGRAREGQSFVLKM